MSLLPGRKCEWVVDSRPMPGLYPGDDADDSPCWDMSLITKLTGTILDTHCTLLGGWVALVEVDNRKSNSIVEVSINNLKLLPP